MNKKVNNIIIYDETLESIYATTMLLRHCGPDTTCVLAKKTTVKLKLKDGFNNVHIVSYKARVLDYDVFLDCDVSITFHRRSVDSSIHPGNRMSLLESVEYMYRNLLPLSDVDRLFVDVFTKTYDGEYVVDNNLVNIIRLGLKLMKSENKELLFNTLMVPEVFLTVAIFTGILAKEELAGKYDRIGNSGIDIKRSGNLLTDSFVGVIENRSWCSRFQKHVGLKQNLTDLIVSWSFDDMGKFYYSLYEDINLRARNGDLICYP